MNKTNVTGIIIAGGKSSRMGKNKALLEINGIKLIEYVYNALLPVTNEILVSSNSNDFDFLKTETVHDVYKNIGPAGGIYSSLLKSKTEQNIIVSCDNPLLTTAFFTFLINKAQNFDVSIPCINNFAEPIIGIYKKHVAVDFKKAIEKEIYSPYKIIKSLNYQTLNILNSYSFYHPLMFKSVNTIADYKKVVSEFV